MSKFKAVVEYDGTAYHGWQLQKDLPTIQGQMESALERILETPTRVHGAGRTDAGVHAVGQVAHFIADWSRTLRFQGRIRHPPMPAITDNTDEVFKKEGFYPLIEPFDLKGVGSISYRYLDPSRQDDTWLYVPVIRRVRRMSSAQRSVPNIAADSARWKTNPVPYAPASLSKFSTVSASPPVSRTSGNAP